MLQPEQLRLLVQLVEWYRSQADRIPGDAPTPRLVFGKDDAASTLVVDLGISQGVHHSFDSVGDCWTSGHSGPSTGNEQAASRMGTERRSRCGFDTGWVLRC